MPHFPKPFFRKDRGLWYLQLRGRQLNLGADRDAAFDQYFKLIGQPAGPNSTPIGTSPYAVTLIDLFLDWCQKNRELRTYEFYRERCQGFVDSIDHSLTLDRLKPYHLQQWADAHDDWNPGMRRGAITAVQRAFNWAVKCGHIERSPVARVEKPASGRRELVIDANVYAKMLSIVKDEPFRDLLVLAWETGARPQELLKLEARHYDVPNHRWVFVASEAKGKRHIRVVYLTQTAFEITERLSSRYPEGRLLRNIDGAAWHRNNVSCRFSRIRIKLGGPKYCLYTFRHSFAQRHLEAGVDALTVATLLGHRDVSMLGKVYSHLAQNPEHLRRSLQSTSSS